MKQLLLLLICTIFFGCSSYQRPVIPTTKLSDKELRQLVMDLRQTDLSIHSLKVISRTRLTHADEKMTMRHAINLKKPDKLRIDTLPQAAAFTINVFSTRENDNIFIDSNQKEALKSLDGDKLLNKTLNIPLKLSEAISYLTGTIPAMLLDEGLTAERLNGYQDQNEDFVLTWNDLRYYWRIDGESKALKSFRSYDKFNRNLILVIDYNYKENGTLNGLELSFPRYNVKFSMLYSAPNFNNAAKTELFNIEVPKGYKLYRID